MKHDTTSVYAFQKKIMPLLKEKFPDLEEIIYLSDGCAGHYKNKKNFKNILLHKNDFGLKAQWHFFPTSHGKGPCDGIGGMIKNRARDASLRQEKHIKDAKTFYEWAENTAKSGQWKADYNIVYVPEKDYGAAERHLRKRFTDLKTIPGTQTFHEFIPIDEKAISANLYSDRNANKQTFEL